jgi:pseudaminic acid cytidylyltransferase
VRVAVIPARGGSKRLPRKNIRDFCGKPMIVWSIEAALASRCFDRLVVSTDDHEIAAIAKQAGAEIPFMRPPELSDDTTSTVPVIAHAIEFFQNNGMHPSQTCCIYAASPFVEPSDIVRGLTILQESDADYAFSATSFPHPIQRAFRLSPGGHVAMLQPEHAATRSQDLPETYHDAGQFYWGSANAWLSGAPVLGGNSIAVVLPRHRVQDIDTLEDCLRAEALFRVLQAHPQFSAA